MKNRELVIAIVNSGFADEVMVAAQEAGATGGTVIKGRGTGSKKFMGMTIEPEKEIILIIAEKEKTVKLMDTIYEKAGRDSEGKAVVFALPVEGAVGLIENEKEEQDG